jgi:hypothetical protein
MELDDVLEVLVLVILETLDELEETVGEDVVVCAPDDAPDDGATKRVLLALLIISLVIVLLAVRSTWMETIRSYAINGNCRWCESNILLLLGRQSSTNPSSNSPANYNNSQDQQKNHMSFPPTFLPTWVMAIDSWDRGFRLIRLGLWQR